jgi:hypothetical protein
MFKFLKAKNAKDWKTTLMSAVGAVVMLAGILWPEKVNAETQEVIKSSFNEIIIGVGALIPIIVGIFGSKDGDKA